MGEKSHAECNRENLQPNEKELRTKINLSPKRPPALRQNPWRGPAFPKSFPNVLENAELNKAILFLTSELFLAPFVLRCTVNLQKEVFSLI